MKRYILECTILTGPNAGSIYYLRKGGYVTESDAAQTRDTTYKSYRLAVRECRRREQINDRDRRDERYMRQRCADLGLTATARTIHELESYEPFAVNI